MEKKLERGAGDALLRSWSALCATLDTYDFNYVISTLRPLIIFHFLHLKGRSGLKVGPQNLHAPDQ
jgi:hypothetical protein